MTEATDGQPNVAVEEKPPATVTVSNYHCSHACGAAEPSAASTVGTSTDAAPALQKSELLRMIDFGLGRGIDATNPKPWANKRSYQVRPVVPESVLATEEGGSIQIYYREVWSSVHLKANLKASVDVPQPSQAPVEIGADAEVSRSKTSELTTRGTKVINRSVSFVSDYDDSSACGGKKQPEEPVSAEGGSSEEASDADDSTESVATAHRVLVSFEDRLCKWIAEKLEEKLERKVENLKDFVSCGGADEKKLILLFCTEFVSHFKITHYVSYIQLGALTYSVFSKEDFDSSFGGGGNIGFGKVGTLGISGSRSSKKAWKTTHERMIGKITGNEVSRGTHDEAVVGVKVQPLFILVKKIPYLQFALQWSINRYIEEHQDPSTGPFLVAFGTGRQKLYWKVNGNYEVRATNEMNEASAFYIIPYENCKHPHEFHIAYIDENEPTEEQAVTDSLAQANAHPKKTVPLRYLDADVSVFGTNSGPLRFVYHVQERSRLLLFGRVDNGEGPISTTTWSQGDDMFFINCTRRRLKRDGYIGMRRHRCEWVSACFSQRSAHNEQDKFMLFRLLPESCKSVCLKPTPTVDPLKDLSVVKTLDERLKSFGVV